MAKDNHGKDDENELEKRITKDEYMSFDVRECYTSFKRIIKIMVQGHHEKNPFCSVLIPCYTEDVPFSPKELDRQNEDRVYTFLTCKRSIYPDEWKNFLERVKCTTEDVKEYEHLKKELRLWASYRGQTLRRTCIVPPPPAQLHTFEY